MRIVFFHSFFWALSCGASVIAAGCSHGDDNAPSSAGQSSGSGSGSTSNDDSGTTSSGATSSGATSSGSSGSGSSGGSTSSSGGASSGAPADSGGGSGSSSGSTTSGGSDAGACPSGLQDKMTACTGTEPTCVKGCGPDVSSGGLLGVKPCSCNMTTMVYNCMACMLPQPLPACYTPSSASPPACPSGTANGAACTTPCDNSSPTANPVCSFTTDAGKLDGCVCITKSGASMPTWACATSWW